MKDTPNRTDFQISRSQQFANEPRPTGSTDLLFVYDRFVHPRTAALAINRCVNSKESVESKMIVLRDVVYKKRVEGREN